MIAKYDLIHYFEKSNPIIRWIEKRRVDKILRELQTADDSDTLEVGCGAGHILRQVPKGRLHGFDLSPQLVAYTRQKLEQSFPDRVGVIAEGDAQHWPKDISGRSYTNIYSSEVIEHIPEPRRLMEELYQVVDGRTRSVVISTPNEPLINRLKSLLNVFGIYQALFPGHSLDMTEEWHLSSFDLPLMRKMCEGLFTIKKIQGAPFRFFPIRYIYTLTKIETR